MTPGRRSLDTMETLDSMESRTSLSSVPEEKRLSFKSNGRAASASTLGDEETEEAEALARTLLPDVNADEMIAKFRGREHELLQSLRWLQERTDGGATGATGMNPDDFAFGPGADVGAPDADPDDSASSSEGEDGTSDIEHDSASKDGLEAGGIDLDKWQRDLEREISDSGSSGHGTPQNRLNGNPQAPSLKSPPELAKGSMHAEKKDDFPQHNSDGDLAYDEDENDVPPAEELGGLPSMVHTKVMRSVSSLSQPGFHSSFNDSQVSSMNDSQVSSINDSPAEFGSASTDSHVSFGSASTVRTAEPSGRRTVAKVKLRAWDPADPRWKVELTAATNILLPDPAFMEETKNNYVVETGKAAMNGAEGVLPRERRGRAGADASERRRKHRALSMVREEPEKPPERGDSFFDPEGLGVSTLSSTDDEQSFSGEHEQSSPGEDERLSSGEDNRQENANPWGWEPRGELEVGTLVGIQPRASSSSSSLRASWNCLEQDAEWKAGKSVYLHKFDLLPLDKLPQLYHEIDGNFDELRELVMDGFPPSSIGMKEAELIFEALGTNTSIKRLSMRYSNVDDDLAALLALALVDNVDLIQLLLEGNEMTNVSAKNFYSVLKKNNETLRLLDLSENPMIDEDVREGLDQFMEQRALKRTLRNKAEKAKRAARGMPPDASLDDDDDMGDGRMTVMCPQSSIDVILAGDNEEAHEQNLQQQQSPGEDDAAQALEPYPGEHFRDFMERIDQMKESADRSTSYNRGLSDESDRDREAFHNFAPSEQYSKRSQRQVTEVPGSPTLMPRSQYESLADDSADTSITSHSSHRAGTEHEVITLSSNAQRGLFEPNSKTESSNRALSVSWADRDSSAPNRMDATRTQDPIDEGRGQSAKREAVRVAGDAAREPNDGGVPIQADTMNSPFPSQLSETLPESSLPRPEMGSNKNSTRSLVSTMSGTSVGISEEDCTNLKSAERAMRQQVAAHAASVGAHYIEEAAPQRQNRGSGGGRSGGGRSRRPRGSRTESQRRRRLAELTGGGAGAGASDGGAAPVEQMLDADIELADAAYSDGEYSGRESRRGMERRRSSKLLQVMRLDDDAGATRTDRRLCGVFVFFLVVMVVLIVLLRLNPWKR